MLPMIGAKIVHIRPMTDKELQQEGWTRDFHAPAVIILDNGYKIYASQDEEGNGPGALFGLTPKNQHIMIGYVSHG